ASPQPGITRNSGLSSNSFSAAACGRMRLSLIPAVPVDDVLQSATVEIGAQVFDKQIDATMTFVVAGTRYMRRDQNARVLPQPLRRQMLELADIDIERGAAQMAAVERLAEGVFLDYFAPRDIDHDTPL